MAVLPEKLSPRYSCTLLAIYALADCKQTKSTLDTDSTGFSSVHDLVASTSCDLTCGDATVVGKGSSNDAEANNPRSPSH